MSWRVLMSWLAWIGSEDMREAVAYELRGALVALVYTLLHWLERLALGDYVTASA